MEFILLFLASQFVGEDFGIRKLFFKFVEESRVLLFLIFKSFSVLLLALPRVKSRNRLVGLNNQKGRDDQSGGCIRCLAVP